jgi:hypothetical protein
MKVINTYHLGCTLAPGGDQLLTVLTEDGVGKWAAYMGVVPLPDTDSDKYEEERHRQAERIATKGMKLNYRQAVGYFPGIAAEKYRA